MHGTMLQDKESVAHHPQVSTFKVKPKEGPGHYSNRDRERGRVAERSPYTPGSHLAGGYPSCCVEPIGIVYKPTWGANNMVQLIKVAATTYSNLSSIPGTHTVERGN